MTAILNARGIGGKCGPAPIRQLEPAARQDLLAEPVVAQLLAEAGAAGC